MHLVRLSSRALHPHRGGRRRRSAAEQRGGQEDPHGGGAGHRATVPYQLGSGQAEGATLGKGGPIQAAPGGAYHFLGDS